MEKTLSELEQAQLLIEAEAKKIDELCSNEINEVLKKYNRQLVVNGISLVKAS
jgi:hypothetical protein